MGDREALARLLDPFAWEIGSKVAMELALMAADRILAAGWRPPPELLAADLPSLDAEARPARFRLRVTETPPPEPGAEPQAAAPSADWLRRKIATDPDMDADAGGPPQAAASEVVAQAQRFINSFSHLAKPPQPTMSFAREVVAQHARAEAAERERDEQRKFADQYCRTMRQQTDRATEARAEIERLRGVLTEIRQVSRDIGDPAEAANVMMDMARAALEAGHGR